MNLFVPPGNKEKNSLFTIRSAGSVYGSVYEIRLGTLYSYTLYPVLREPGARQAPRIKNRNGGRASAAKKQATRSREGRSELYSHSTRRARIVRIVWDLGFDRLPMSTTVVVPIAGPKKDEHANSSPSSNHIFRLRLEKFEWHLVCPSRNFLRNSR